MLIQDHFVVQYPEQGRFNVRVRGWPDSDHWMTPSPPEPQLHQGFKRIRGCHHHLLSHFYPFFISPALSVCSLPDPNAVLLHRSPPCVSFCFITNQIRLQYLPLGSDLQVGKGK